MSYPLTQIQRNIVNKAEFYDLTNDEGLYPHQEFVRRYLSPYTPYRNVLLFHTLGSGKSLICISIAVDHYLHDKKRCLIVTKGNSGTDNFRKQIDMYFEMANLDISRSEYNRIFVMEHYIALHNTIITLSKEEIVAKYSNYIIVLDEIHNVRKLKFDNRLDLSDKVYNSLEKIVKYPSNTKVLLVTATPMTNDVDQLYSTMKLICNSGSDFNGLVSYNAKIKHRPKAIYHGIPGFMKGMNIYPSRMISHQRRAHIRETKKGTPKDIYRTLTYISLFCFPDTLTTQENQGLSNNQNSLTIFNSTHNDSLATDLTVPYSTPKFIAQKGTTKKNLYGKNIFTSGIMVPKKREQLITSMKTGQQRLLKYTFYEVVPEYRKYLVGNRLRKCSSKYYKIVESINGNNKGPVFIYIDEVKGSGLLLLANVLEENGYELYVGDHLDTITPKKRYTFCVGEDTLVPNMADRLEGFNHPKNIKGDYVNILIGSKIIGESITLLNVRMFHVVTIHWNDSTVDQAVGRVIRSGSHDRLEPQERTVDIYIHVAMLKEPGENEYEGTDLYKLQICNEKQEKISEVENMLKECAIDKYIGSTPEKIDSSTYILYYVDKYMKRLVDLLISSLKGIMLEPIPIDKVVKRMGIEQQIATEVIYKVVTNNVCVYPNRYLRESVGKLYLVEDPSVPFFFIKGSKEEVSYNIKEDIPINIKPSIPPFDRVFFKKFKKMSLIEKIIRLRTMHFLDRISFVENIFKNNLDPDVQYMFKNLFTKYNKNLYHIMSYRIPGDAYTAVLPIPKPNVLQNKTRILYDKKWRYVDILDIQEKNIIRYMEEKHDKLMRSIDEKESIFLIISLIDDKSRLRTRLFEKTSLGDRDKRYIRKGRCLPSILKTDLALIYAYIKIHVTKECKPPGEINDYIRTKWKQLEKRGSYDKHVLIYGYKSILDMKKKNKNMYNLFIYAMVEYKTDSLVTVIEEIMVMEGKYIFL